MDNSQDPWADTNKEPITEKQESKKQEEKQTLPILSLILSVIASPVGLVLSIITMHLVKEENVMGKKLAKFGLIISIIILSLSVVAIILLFVLKKYSISFL